MPDGAERDRSKRITPVVNGRVMRVNLSVTSSSIVGDCRTGQRNWLRTLRRRRTEPWKPGNMNISAGWRWLIDRRLLFLRFVSGDRCPRARPRRTAPRLLRTGSSQASAIIDWIRRLLSPNGATVKARFGDSPEQLHDGTVDERKRNFASHVAYHSAVMQTSKIKHRSNVCWGAPVP